MSHGAVTLSGTSPLDEIVDGARNDEVAKGKGVAHRLGADDIRVWTDRELLGYGSGDLLPEYRSREATACLEPTA